MTREKVLEKLKSLAKLDQLDAMAKFGLTKDNRLGVSIPNLRSMAKEIGKDHPLALELWDTGIPDAGMLAAMIDEPEKVSENQMEKWVQDFQSWDVCDQVCMNLFEKTAFALKKITEWAEREEEFVKRAAFSLIACLAWHDKEAADRKFLGMLPVIKRGATDERNYVKKAVSWSLRHIGKRNPDLNRAAIHTAREIKQLDSRAARWIASDAIRELESEAVQKRLQKRFRQRT